MDGVPDLPDITLEEVILRIELRLVESQGNNPPGLMQEIIQQLKRAVEKFDSRLLPEPIDTVPFAEPEGETKARVEAGVQLGMELIRRYAAKNPQRKAEYDALAARPDGVAELAARRATAARNLIQVIRRLLRGSVEALEAEIGQTEEDLDQDHMEDIGQLIQDMEDSFVDLQDLEPPQHQ